MSVMAERQPEMCSVKWILDYFDKNPDLSTRIKVELIFDHIAHAISWGNIEEAKELHYMADDLLIADGYKLEPPSFERPKINN